MSRLERRVERTVEAWPAGCHAIGVVASPGDGEWAGRAASALITAAASRHRLAFLVDLTTAAPALPLGLDAPADAGGLAEVAAGRATLGEVAITDEDRSFAYIPAGRTDDPAELTRSRPFQLLVERARGADGVVLVLLDRASRESVGAAAWADGWVLLGEDAPGGDGLPGDAPELARIRPAGKPRTARAGRGRRRRRRSTSASTRRAAAVGLFVVAGLAVGTCFVGRSASDDEPMSRLVRITPEQAGGEARRGQGVPASEATGAGETGGGRPDGAPVLDGAAAPYSVLVASYASEEDARRQVERLSEGSDRLFFLSPTLLQEDRLWYRVYAGLRPGRDDAGRLMRELVDAGVKEEARNWDLRPVPWAFRLATAAERGEAESRLSELRRRGVPAYAVPVIARGDTSYRLYAGAYETEDAAAPLRKRLSEAGLEARLVRRSYGEP